MKECSMREKPFGDNDLNPNNVGQLGRRRLLQAAAVGVGAIGAASLFNIPFSEAEEMSQGPDNFYTSDRVAIQKVNWQNQYQMRMVGNLFTPTDLDRSKTHPAIVVGHPMGAVKEQSANLYATKMAEQGFVAMSLDLPFWGESEGARNAVSPDMYTEAYMSAVDYATAQPFVDAHRIGVIGICGSGSYVVNAAKIDPRMRAIATVSMYDMGSVNRNGLNHSQSQAQRQQAILAATEQRNVEFAGGPVKHVDGMLETLRPNATPIEREFFDFYRTPRGQFVPQGSTLYLTTNRPITAEIKFLNFYPFNDIETISPRPMLFITGDQAHSKEFSEDAYRRAAQPKELMYIPGAGHVDLYDNVDLIPFGKLKSFFDQHLAN
jgi:fermentation-respiration switch protein FrsA (DUF1100 family)